MRFHAAYEVCASDTLTMTLTVTNTGGEPMSYEAALHSYLHVGDVLGARLVGLRGATYLDATEAGFPPKLQEQPSVMFGDQPVDRVYSHRQDRLAADGGVESRRAGRQRHCPCQDG